MLPPFEQNTYILAHWCCLFLGGDCTYDRWNSEAPEIDHVRVPILLLRRQTFPERISVLWRFEVRQSYPVQQKHSLFRNQYKRACQGDCFKNFDLWLAIYSWCWCIWLLSVFHTWKILNETRRIKTSIFWYHNNWAVIRSDCMRDEGESLYQLLLVSS